MNDTYDGMSVPSAARAEKALELHTKSTLFVPTARFTYRLLHQFNGEKPEPASTDAREIARFLVAS